MSQILIRTSEEMKREITNEAQNIGIPVNALMAQILYDWKKALDKERAEKNL